MTNPDRALVRAAPALSPAITAPPDQNPAAVYLARLAPGSRRTMATALATIAGWLTSGRDNADTCRWHELRYQHTQALRAHLAEQYAPATANKLLSALRGVLQECWRLGLMNAEDQRRAADVAGVKAATLPRGRALPAGELRALFVACAADPTPAGRRDAAIVAVLVGAGLRRAEAAALDLADYDAESGALTVRSGKGRKDRISYLTNGAGRAMQAWLQARGDAAGALFCPVDRLGVVTVRRMTSQSVYNALAKRGDAAAIARFSPHDLRRTFVSELLDAGADIATVQRLAGHASVTTTQRYDRRGEQAKRKAAALFHVPYVA